MTGMPGRCCGCWRPDLHDLHPGTAPAGDLAVVNAQAVSGGVRYRVVTDQPPAGAEAVEPTLEDGYAGFMRDSRQPVGNG